MPRALLAAADDDDEEEEDDAEEDIDGEKVVRGKKERPDSHVEYESHHEGDISELAASHTEEALKSGAYLNCHNTNYTLQPGRLCFCVVFIFILGVTALQVICFVGRDATVLAGRGIRYLASHARRSLLSLGSLAR
jgi:hypothetical protein